MSAQLWQGIGGRRKERTYDFGGADNVLDVYSGYCGRRRKRAASRV